MAPMNFTKEEAIAILWGFAARSPEETRGGLQVQIRACRSLYRDFGYEPALKRLSELAEIDPARTKGRRRDQEAAEKLLKRLVSSIKPDKSGVQ
jgi:hypothetical protein